MTTKKSNHPPAETKPEESSAEAPPEPKGEVKRDAPTRTELEAPTNVAAAQAAQAPPEGPTGPVGALGAKGAPAAPEAAPEPAKGEPLVPAGEPVSPLVAAADALPTAEGHPDPHAQSKITGAAGAVDRGNLVAALARLPLVSQLSGLRANAQAGFYGTVPPAELVSALRAVKLEDEEARTTLDTIIVRAEQGEFSGRR